MIDTPLIAGNAPVASSFATIQHLARKFSENTLNPSADEAGSFLNKIVSPFFASLCPSFSFRFQFFDHTKTSQRFHSELILVHINNSECIISIPHLWLSAKQNDHLIALLPRAIVLPVVMDGYVAAGLTGFVFELGDNGFLPGLSFCSKNQFALLVPDFSFLVTQGYESLRLSWADDIAWEARQAKVFWRGSTTGLRRYAPPSAGQPDNVAWLPRLYMAAIAKDPEISEYCDIGISKIVQMPELHLVERIKSSGLLKPGVPKAEFRNFRGLVDIDGNSNSWEGLLTALLTGSCVLKIGSAGNFCQWYYSKLKPFENYVPINHDFCDFRDAILWMLAHDREAAEIGAKGRILAQEISFEKEVLSVRTRLAAWIHQGKHQLLGI